MIDDLPVWLPGVVASLVLLLLTGLCSAAWRKDNERVPIDNAQFQAALKRAPYWRWTTYSLAIISCSPLGYAVLQFLATQPWASVYVRGVAGVTLGIAALAALWKIGLEGLFPPTYSTTAVLKLVFLGLAASCALILLFPLVTDPKIRDEMLQLWFDKNKGK